MRNLIFILIFLLSSTNLIASDIAVVTIAHGNSYQNSVRVGTESMRAYCQKHGYDFIFCDENLDPSRNIYWSKIQLVLKVLQNPSYKWVVWLDADILIMNLGIPLEDLIDEEVNFCIAQDLNGINSGVFFIRNCDWSKQLFSNVYARTDCITHFWPEQMAIVSELKKKEFASMAKIVPQRLFNSYSPETSSSLTSTYQPGDFLMHFASIHDSVNLSAIFDRYSKHILNDRYLITLDQYLGYYGFILSPTDSNVNEGYLSGEQKEQYRRRLALYPEIKSILEIGLNGGHSAENFFQCCPNLKKLLSFDVNKHSYTQPAVEYLRRKYKEKFEFIIGDSALTVPNYAASSEQMFDLIYIDGMHSYEYVIQDILNCRALAHSDTILLIDDYLLFIKDAVTSLVEKGIIQIVHEDQSWGENGGRFWAEARYIFP